MHEFLPSRLSLARRWLLLRLPLIFVAALIAFLAGACGGPSPEERFAEEACSTTVPRARELLEIYDDVRHVRATPGPDAWAQQLRFISGGQEATRKLRAELRALRVPDTDASSKASNYLDNFARLAFERMAEEERRVRGLPENITLLQSIDNLNRLEFALDHAFVDMKSAPGPVLDYIPELKEPFEKADSCKELAVLGTE